MKPTANRATSRSSDILEIISKTIRRVSPQALNKTITTESLLLEDLALDSLDLVAVILQVQDEFEVEIDSDEITELRSVNDLIGSLTKQLRCSGLSISNAICDHFESTMRLSNSIAQPSENLRRRRSRLGGESPISTLSQQYRMPLTSDPSTELQPGKTCTSCRYFHSGCNFFPFSGPRIARPFEAPQRGLGEQAPDVQVLTALSVTTGIATNAVRSGRSNFRR